MPRHGAFCKNCNWSRIIYAGKPGVWRIKCTCDKCGHVWFTNSRYAKRAFDRQEEAKKKNKKS